MHQGGICVMAQAVEVVVRLQHAGSQGDRASQGDDRNSEMYVETFEGGPADGRVKEER